MVTLPTPRLCFLLCVLWHMRAQRQIATPTTFVYHLLASGRLEWDPLGLSPNVPRSEAPGGPSLSRPGERATLRSFSCQALQVLRCCPIAIDLADDCDHMRRGTVFSLLFTNFSTVGGTGA